MHGEPLRPLRPLHRETVHPLRLEAAAAERLHLEALPAAAAACESLEMASATAAVRHGELRPPAATAVEPASAVEAATAPAAALHLGLAAAVAATAAMFSRPCCGRGRNRQSGDTRCKEKPGHRNFSFRTVKTDRPAHRSNR
jgi:hypothetical protein